MSLLINMLFLSCLYVIGDSIILCFPRQRLNDLCQLLARCGGQKAVFQFTILLLTIVGSGGGDCFPRRVFSMMWKCFMSLLYNVSKHEKMGPKSYLYRMAIINVNAQERNTPKH